MMPENHWRRKKSQQKNNAMQLSNSLKVCINSNKYYLNYEGRLSNIESFPIRICPTFVVQSINSITLDKPSGSFECLLSQNSNEKLMFGKS